MRSLVLSLAATLAFAGAALAQAPEVMRGSTSSTTQKKITTATTPAKPAVQKTAAAQSSSSAHVKHPVTPQTLRGSRYGGFAPAPAVPETPPTLDLASPRTLSLLNVNSSEQLTVTYWADGAYKRDALNKLNHFLRDSKTGEQTEMDPLVFDVLWHTMQISGYGGTVEVLSAFRSPETNAWLASVSRGVARDSQHMNGNAMDIRFPGVPVFKIRQAARSLQMGGVGFYPRSGFVHLDTGPVRYW
ncbi:MAG: DUF882 domain-containing protein [Reyranella sp.]|uniref:DUF882 domain-containing protein n=1 Tax=Reyranella sp. TaxID=1929291 RepID=UPI001ACBDD5F|nr:DUF882 domain-containing protein [Reyranella sp.]MBN9090253.1 DUF882 domain-containing protein [Reyranella sp.]